MNLEGGSSRPENTRVDRRRFLGLPRRNLARREAAPEARPANPAQPERAAAFTPEVVHPRQASPAPPKQEIRLRGPGVGEVTGEVLAEVGKAAGSVARFGATGIAAGLILYFSGVRAVVDTATGLVEKAATAILEKGNKAITDFFKKIFGLSGGGGGKKADKHHDDHHH